MWDWPRYASGIACRGHRADIGRRRKRERKVKKAIFVHVDGPWLDRIEIASSRDKLPEQVRHMVELRRAERKAQAQVIRPVTTAPPDTDRDKAHPAVEATARAWRRAKPSRPGVAQAIGPELCGISISGSSVERIISFLDRLARTCDARGPLAAIQRASRSPKGQNKSRTS